ncbi:MAG: DEAD/DEAH box helicase family protein [Candidatus Nanosalina sp.]
MEFEFDPEIDYQLQAIDSVVKLFSGDRSEGNSIASSKNDSVVGYRSVPNELNLSEEEILDILREVQEENGLDPDESLEGMNFTIEMETGTGKTYTYLRTLLELNKEYGMRKFIIVVPSVAIKEGVLKTLRQTRKHFKDYYDSPIYRFYEYDSSDLNKLKQFSRSNEIEIMVMTIQSFRDEDRNVINNPNDRTNGKKPIQLIQETNPIVVMDEPQNMETENSKEALERLNPLFKLRYSATHRNYYNLLYRLGPAEAYQRDLVKHVDVLSVVEDDDYRNVLIKVIDIDRSSRGIRAEVEIYKDYSSGVKRKTTKVYQGDDLYEKSKGLEEYRGFVVSGIDLRYNTITFENGVTLEKGDVQGLNREKLMETQIEKTIEEHFRKQEKLEDYGIKVLSLFFIDRVSNYIGDEAFIRETFEEKFKEIKQRNVSYTERYDDYDAEDVHDGYFAKKDNGEYYSDNSTSYMRNDEDTYDLIMKNKERLLSFNEPTQFIFSHSALREGWDNPNVFNICTLNESYSRIKKRQEIGRGVRIPVNQEGERVFESENILTVVANESYQDFASKLQTEYEEEYGDADAGIETDNRRERVEYEMKSQEELENDSWEDFNELWRRISKKSRYEVEFNSEKFKEKCVEEINELDVDEIKLRIQRGEIQHDEEGVRSIQLGEDEGDLNEEFEIRNFLATIAEETQITKETISDILSDVDNLEMIFENPHQFVNSVSEILNRAKKEMIVEDIEYFEVDDSYELSQFEEKKEGYEKRLVEVDKSVYSHVKTDSEGEKEFAETLDKNPRIKFLIKLPSWYRIDTPVGKYNPDWGIAVEDRDESDQLQKKMYLVRETKKGDLENLRPSEENKIKCARKHYVEIFEDEENSNYEVYNMRNGVDIGELI